MSQENVEIARRANAAFNDADFVEFAEYLHPDITLTDQANSGLGCRRLGHGSH